MFFVSYQKGKILLRTTIQTSTLAVSIDPFDISEGSQKMDAHKMRSFHALLGITRIKDIPFLVLASEVNLTSTIEGSSIYEIKRVEMLPVCDWGNKDTVCGQLKEEIQAVKELFVFGFHYYSDNYNLSYPYILNKFRQASYEQRTYYEQFVWNKAMMECKSAKILTKWCRPIIQGYIENFSLLLPNSTKIIYYLVSRRSCLKAGTRFYSRGIDDNGNVANFTETQQIICLRDYVLTHLQIRGSVPIFFEQIGVNGIMEELNISRNPALTEKAFVLHFQKIKTIYKRVLCLNLLSVKKSKELKLINFFQSMVSQTNLDYVRYQYFDFHQECKGDKFENSEKLIEKVQEVLFSFNFNCFNTRKNLIMGEQTGVVRTNCLDCLDRTNYIQSRVALTMLKRILECMSMPEQREIYENQKIFEVDLTKMEEATLINLFSMVWADNGDSVSLHYTGIGSTHTEQFISLYSVTKGGGKRGFFGTFNHKFKSLMRFYTQFTDIRKHEAINTLVMTKGSIIKRDSAIHSQQYHDSLLFSFLVTPEVSQKINSLQKISEINPSFVVVELYSEVPAEWHTPISSFWKKKPKFETEWRERVVKTIESAGYSLVSSEQVERNCLIVFTTKSLTKQITNLKTEKIQPSLKRSDSFLITKFTFLNSSFVFTGANCYKLSNFYQMLDEAHQNAFQNYKLGQYKSSSILEQNYRIILGSIGSESTLDSIEKGRVQKQLKEVEEANDLKSKYRVLSGVVDHDQFLKTHLDGKTVFARNYSEGPLTFFPGRNRILFWNSETLIVKVIDYVKQDNCVYGHYSYQIKKRQ